MSYLARMTLRLKNEKIMVSNSEEKINGEKEAITLPSAETNNKIPLSIIPPVLEDDKITEKYNEEKEKKKSVKSLGEDEKEMVEALVPPPSS